MRFIKALTCFAAIAFVLVGCAQLKYEPRAPESFSPATTAQDNEPAQTGPVPFNLVKSEQVFTASQTFQAGIGDMDGDGDLDLVFANPQGNAAEVWFNDGLGSFTDSGQRLTTYGHGVVLGDFDADGDLDAFMVCHQFFSPSRLYLNDGSGDLEDSGQEFGDASLSAVEVNRIDLNSDGASDIHVVYYAPSGQADKVYLNDGTGNFTDSGLALYETSIAWGDLDGDGDLDYFGKIWNSGYVVQLNQDGDFYSGWRLDDAQSSVGMIALADFDEDGDLDALVANGHRSVGSSPSILFLNDGFGGFRDSGQNLNGTMGAELSVGDLDGDGTLDVYIANMDLPNEVWLNNGTGMLVDSGLRLGAGGDFSGKASLADLDGDGDLDVIVGRFTGAAELWINRIP